MSTAASSKPAIEGGAPVRSESLPFYRAPIDERDIAAVVDALRSGWLTVGPRTERFEAEIARYAGAKHAIAVSSCSEAMFLALRALDVGPGDEVITSANTFASTVHAITHCGATPVLVDIEAETFGPDPERIAAAITPRTKAILPVHFGGQACRIEEIMEIARQRELPVLEDAAHAFGASVNGRRIGGVGTVTAYSFYATKNLTTAEGGALTTDDDRLAARLRPLSYHGMSRDTWTRYTDRGSWFYEVMFPGYKCNLNDVLSSLGLAQLERIDELLEARRRLAQQLHSRLSSITGLELPCERPGNYHTWHLYVARIRPGALRVDRDHVSRALSADRIGNSVHFIPIYRHPFFAGYGVEQGAFPVCEDYFSRCISLPLFPGMLPDDVNDVGNALERIFTWYARP